LEAGPHSYLSQLLDEDFTKAISEVGGAKSDAQAAQNPTQQPGASSRIKSARNDKSPGKPELFAASRDSLRNAAINKCTPKGTRTPVLAVRGLQRIEKQGEFQRILM
jgi:hypothetical protein